MKRNRSGRGDQRATGFDPRWLREARVQLPQRRTGPPPEQDLPGGGGSPVERPRGRSQRWRAAAVLLAVLELAALVVLVSTPVFQVRQVVVHGARRLSAQQVVHAAGLDRPGSVFTVDGSGIRRRLQSTNWIEEVVVSPQLPDQIVITVKEWEPVAVYHPLQGGVLYLNDQGVSLGTAGADQASFVRIEGPAPSTNPGHPMLNGRLLVALVNIQRGLPGLISQMVVAFRFDRCWNLTMVGGSGWRALFGRMLTASDYSTLTPKLSALNAVSSYVNFGDAETYVNLMNPQEPAVGRGENRPPAPTPIPTPTPTSRPSAPASPGGAAPSPSATASAGPSPSAPIVPPSTAACG